MASCNPSLGAQIRKLAARRFAWAVLAGCFLFASLPAAEFSTGRDAPVQLWYWHHSYLSTDDALTKSEALVNRAAAAGYTGVAFWDSGFNLMGDDFWPWENEARLGEIMRYAAKKHMKVLATPNPFGFSNEALEANPNWAEAQRVVGSEFQVDRSGKRLNRKNSFPGLANSSFESGKTDWFDTGDSGIGINTVAHTGKTSAVIVDAPANARLRQKFPLKPWRQYHLRLFFKSSNFKGSSMLSLFDKSDFDKVRLNAYINAAGTHYWTQLDYIFNSQDSTEGYLYLGVWGGSSGILWFDDIQIEETSLVYIVRRGGAPLKVYDPANPSTVFREGVDYKPIFDPHVETTRTPFDDEYHEPAPVLLPKGTQLKPGQTVAIDSYAVFPVPGTHGVAMCMSEPVVWKWIAQNALALKPFIPEGGSILIGFDEIRQMNSCARCRAKNLSAGNLLSSSMTQALKLYGSLLPEATLYTWSDMFDPYHNAKNHYFYVEGDLTGSWTALPRSLVVVNWNLDDLKNSLTWFSGQNSRQPVPHRQIIAGYYDSHNGALSAQQELAKSAGIPGILGLMYTSWDEDYSQLETFAKSAREHWGAYQASVSKDQVDYR